MIVTRLAEAHRVNEGPDRIAIDDRRRPDQPAAPPDRTTASAGDAAPQPSRTAHRHPALAQTAPAGRRASAANPEPDRGPCTHATPCSSKPAPTRRLRLDPAAVPQRWISRRLSSAVIPPQIPASSRPLPNA
jgi:hypothetical protein